MSHQKTLKAIQIGLQNDLNTGAYDQDRTTVRGLVNQRVVDGYPVLAPPSLSFVDIFTLTGETCVAMHSTPNGRIFAITAITAGLARCVLINFNYTTGVHSYVGKVVMTFPNVAATTHTMAFLRVDDSNLSNIKVLIGTRATVAINGGLFKANLMVLADFIQVGFPTIPFATGNNQKAMYFEQDPANIGVNQLNIAAGGCALDLANSKLYVHNGIAATHQFYVYNYATSPTYSTSAITGTEATNTINHAAHAFNNNDQITFIALTGGAGLTAGTTYFVRNAVAGVSYEVSATTGGASINFTTDISSGTVGRAFGITSDDFSHKTGNLPALTGTLLINGSDAYAVPQHGSLTGFPCIFFATNTNLYAGRLSELTVGAVVWASLVTANLLGATNEVIAPVAVNASWSDLYDRAVFTTSTTKIIAKKLVNNVIEEIYGVLNNDYYEGVSNPTVQFGLTTVSDFKSENGWNFFLGSSTGQRGIVCSPVSADSSLGTSYIISPVLDVEDAVSFIGLASSQQGIDTGAVVTEYRQSGFGSEAGGWISIGSNNLLPMLLPSAQIQFKYSYEIINSVSSNPPLIIDSFLAYNSRAFNSEHWEFSFDDTESGVPSRCAFRLKEAYPVSVPNLSFKAYDLSHTLVANHTTTANAGFFEYSSDDGMNWSSLGTIPNVVGTKLRYNFASQPSTDIRPSLQEA